MRSPAFIFLVLCVCIVLQESSGLGLMARLRRMRSKLFKGFRQRGSIFSSMSATSRTPACTFNKDNVPQFSWPTKEKLCFETTPPYPAMRIAEAVFADNDAMEYLALVEQCYVREQMNFTGSYSGYRYKDLCETKPTLLERVWVDTYNGMRDMCYVITPEEQGVYVANCGKSDYIPTQKNCVMDTRSVAGHYCVPDGFVERDIYVFCPGHLKQCKRTKVIVPTGCSCKKYQCLKFTYGA